MTTLKVTFLEPSGNFRVVEADVGISLMEAAVRNGVEGVLADCGGACSCATCHVHFSQEWFDRLAPMAEDEEAMMDAVEDPRPTSRLACQVKLTEALDGLEALVPAEA